MRKLTTDDREVGAENDYGSVGSHVASVLEAAAQAAASVREDAERDAAEKISAASSEANKLIHEAEGLRAEAETAAKAVRERAEAFAERKRKDADDEAAKILENAETVARRQNDALTTSEKALRESISLSRARLGQLVGGLRELADRLEHVLEADAHDDWSLEDALKPSARSE